MEAGEVTGIATATLGAGYFLRLAVDRFVSRADKDRDGREAERDKASMLTLAAINALKQAFADIKSDIRLMGSQVEQTRGQYVELKDRINGGLADNRARLDGLETRVTVIETSAHADARIASLERKLEHERQTAPTPPNPRRKKK